MARPNKLTISKSVHVNLDVDIRPRVLEYIGKRNITITTCINKAVRDLLDSHPVDLRFELLKGIIEKKFNMPKAFTAASFYNVLYLNAMTYPNSSAKTYWTDIIYISSIDKTHDMVYREVQEELKRELDGKKTLNP